MKEQLRATLYIEIKLYYGPTREGRGCLRVGAVSSFFFFFFVSQRGPTSANAAPTRADAGSPTWAASVRIGRNRRNAEIPKKKVQNLLLFLSLSCFPASPQSRCCVNWFKKTEERLKKEKV